MHMQKEETTGDHQEFDEMYRRTQAEIYKFIRYRVADKELAKDVLQETYYVAYKKWDILCEHSNPMGWLINTAKNKIRELNKSLKKIECEVDLDADEYTFTEDGYGKSELDLIITKGLTEEEKKDNESLIQELTKRLDWYIMKASDEEFDADEVQTLMKLLDNLKTEEDNVEDELPVEEALDDFWKHCEEREEEERLLLGTEEERDKSEPVAEKEEDKPREGKLHKVLWYFHRRRFAVVAAAVLVVMVLGGSWQVVANAKKHGGFFWWMDKNEEGTTMITAPEGVEDFVNFEVGKCYSIEEVPSEYSEYVKELLEIKTISDYSFDYAKIHKDQSDDTVSVLMKNDENNIRFQIKIYPQEILRVRETYPGYVFETEFEDEGIFFDVFSKEEISGENTYLMYFYYGREKYIVMGRNDKSVLQDIVVEYKNVVLNHHNK